MDSLQFKRAQQIEDEIQGQPQSKRARQDAPERRVIRRYFRHDKLPRPEMCRELFSLGIRNYSEKHVASVFVTGLDRIVVGFDEGTVRVFAKDGAIDPIHVWKHDGVFLPAFSLGGDVFVSIARETRGLGNHLLTFSALTGRRCDFSVVGDSLSVSQGVVLSDERFLLAYESIADDGLPTFGIVFYKHKEGREMREEKRITSVHKRAIRGIAECNGVIVTGSDDMSARVWRAETGELLADLKGHPDAVDAVDINNDWIATGCNEGRLRLFRNGGAFELVAAFKGLDTDNCRILSIIGTKLVMSVWNSTVCVTSLDGGGRVVSRMDLDGSPESVSILPRGRLLVRSSDTVAIVQPPLAVVEEIEKHCDEEATAGDRDLGRHDASAVDAVETVDQE